MPPVPESPFAPLTWITVPTMCFVEVVVSVCTTTPPAESCRVVPALRATMAPVAVAVSVGNVRVPVPKFNWAVEPDTRTLRYIVPEFAPNMTAPA